MTENVKLKDFVEIKYTGTSDGKVFDSNIEEDLKKINPNEKPRETIIIIGERMVVPGLDNALEGKEIGKEYEIMLTPQEGFGERKRELMRMIPLKMFHEKEVNPQPGMVFTLDNSLAKIIAVSGARVMTDFNNPLAGKNINYKFKIARKVEDIEGKAKAVFELMFRFVPKFEIKGVDIIIKGHKGLQVFIDAIQPRFKELLGKDLKLEIVDEKDLKEAEEKAQTSEKTEAVNN